MSFAHTVQFLAHQSKWKALVVHKVKPYVFKCVTRHLSLDNQVVPGEGLEPTRFAAPDPKAGSRI